MKTYRVLLLGALSLLAVGLLSFPVSAAQITVAWDANPPAEQVVGYRVWDGTTRVCETALTQCTLDLAIGSHVLTATAFNGYGLESDHSLPLTVTIGKPSVVQRLNVTITNKVTVGGP